MQKLAIISSVQSGIFSGVVQNGSSGFSEAEKTDALKDEKQVFIDAIGIPDIEKKIQIDVIRAMDGIPKEYSADAYILGGSPSMVTERDQKEWIDRLIRFVHNEVNSGKPLFGICFGHQILAAAFGGKIDVMKERKIGRGKTYIKSEGNILFPKDVQVIDPMIESLWSHKQSVTDSGETEVISDSNSIIQAIKIDNAVGTQFHPEFTPEFTSFLIKLMGQQIEQEGLDKNAILEQVNAMKQGNPSNKLLNTFIQRYYNI
ncbi:MAG: gamma-glutamyl-gamma-aminobutyrate hydrolase family protein [Candidatus Gracilibacteria bacterium]